MPAASNDVMCNFLFQFGAVRVRCRDRGLTPWCKPGGWVHREIKSSFVMERRCAESGCLHSAGRQLTDGAAGEVQCHIHGAVGTHLDLEVSLHELYSAHPVLGPRLCGGRARRRQL